MKPLCLITLIFAALAAAGPATSDGGKVLSLDLCADQYLLALMEPDEILAVTQFARMPHSYFRERAMGVPIHHSSLEELISLGARTALRTSLGDPSLDASLSRFGVRIIEIAPANTVEETLDRLREAGRMLDREKKAETLIRAAEARLAALDNAGPLGLSAIYLVPDGTTTGAGTFIDDVLKRSGVLNYAAERGQDGWGTVRLETLVAAPPDAVIATFTEARGETVRGWLPTNHPSLRDAVPEDRILDLPSRLISCPAWIAIDAAAHIVRDLRDR